MTSGTSGSVTVATGTAASGTTTTINTPSLTLTGTVIASTGNLTIQSNGASNALTVVAGSGSALTASAGNVAFNSSGTAGAITMNSGNGTVSANSGSGVINFNVGSGNATVSAGAISGTVQDPNANFSTPAAGNISITVAGGTLTVGQFATASGRSLALANAGGALITTANLQAGTTVSLTSGSSSTLTIGSGIAITGGTGITFTSPTQNINGVVTATTGDVNVQSNAAGYGLTVNMGADVSGTPSTLVASNASGRVNFNTTNAGAITIAGGANNGLISAGDAVYMTGGTGAIAVNVEQIVGCIRPTTTSSVTITTSTGDLTFCVGINTSAVGAGSGGAIAITANGGAIIAGNLTANGSGNGNSAGSITLEARDGITVGDINSNGYGGANGGAIALSAPNEAIIGTYISAQSTAVTGGNGGSITSTSGSLVLSSENVSGNSLDVSSVAGTGGSISITTTDPETFTVGNGDVTGNGTFGNIAANGVTGGSVSLTSYGNSTNNFVINGLITANGTSGLGGNVLFQGQSGNALAVNMNGGTVEAKNDSDDSGIIGFNVDSGQNITLSGTGIVHAGEAVRAGVMDTNTMTLIPGESAGTINISSGVTVENQFQTNGTIPVPPVPPTPGPGPDTTSGGGRNLFNIAALLNQQATMATPDLSKTAVDFTPIYGYASISDEEETRRRSKKANTNNRLTLMIPGAKTYGHAFTGKHLSELIEQGMELRHNTVTNNLNVSKGNILLSPDQEIVVGTHEGNIHMSPGAVAFVMESGSDVVIYDLRQSGPKQIEVEVGKDRLTLHPGHMMVLTRQHVNDFEDIDAECHMISYRSAQQMPTSSKDVRVFQSEFSIASAIVTIEPLNNLIASNDKQDQATLEKIIKGAVMLNDFSGTIDMEQIANMALAPGAEQY
jgi:hypothetical protein